MRSATELIRRQGYAATTVDEICTAAGVTKGAFFHHFHSKEALGCAVIESWCEWGAKHYRALQGEPEDAPRIRLDRLFDGMIAMAEDPSHQPLICLLGMMAQEVSSEHPSIRGTCESGLSGWTALVAELLAEVGRENANGTNFPAEDLAWLWNSVWQGSMLVAKHRLDQGIVANNLRHLKAYISSLLPAVTTVRV